MLMQTNKTVFESGKVYTAKHSQEVPVQCAEAF